MFVRSSKGYLDAKAALRTAYKELDSEGTPEIAIVVHGNKNRSPVYYSNHQDKRKLKAFLKAALADLK